MLFADTGLSGAEISSLFVIWSVTAFSLEVPSGVWADAVSRRRLLTLAPVLTGAGFALWTFLPSYPAFACGFVLWGAGGALRSGTFQALVYEELDRVGAAGSYARVIGRTEALSMTAVMVATALAGPVLGAGGYRAVGAASIAATVLQVLVARSLPESRAHRPDPDRAPAYRDVLRTGLAEVRRSAPVRRSLLLVAGVSGAGALDEYLPLLAASTGVGADRVPLLVLVVTAGAAAGGWLAGRGTRLLAPGLACGAAFLAAGAITGHPVGMVSVAVAFGVFQWAIAAVEARLQERIADPARATITSLSGVGVELVAVLTFAAYALGSTRAGPGPLFALAAVPYLVMALVLSATARRRPR